MRVRVMWVRVVQVGGADHENQNDGVGGSDVGVTVALKPIFERQSIHGHPISALS